jgi:hypothetical protein
MKFGYTICFLLIDKGLIEIVGPQGFSFKAFNFSNRLTFFQSGFIYHYSFIMVFSLVIAFSSIGFFYYNFVSLTTIFLALLSICYFLFV